MAQLAMTSPLAPVVAAVEGLRRRHPDALRCVVPGLLIRPEQIATRATNAQALAVLTVAGWTHARRVPLLLSDATFLDCAGRLGISRAISVAVLDGDPAAGRAGVVVAATRTDLLAVVHDNLCALTADPELARRILEFTRRWSPANHEERNLHLGGRAGAVERHHL